MAREVEFGIRVKVADDGSVTFEEIGEAAEDMGEDIEDGADKGESALSAMSLAVTGLNSLLELSQQVWSTVSDAISGATSAALEQRSETDKQRKDWEKLFGTMDRIQVLLGDILIPIILGVADAFEDTTGALELYIGQNKELIGTKTIEFLVTTGKILTSVVATSLLLTAQAWFGWKEIIIATEVIVNQFFKLILDGSSEAILAMQFLAEAVGADDLVNSLAVLRGEVKLLGNEFELSGDKALGELAKEAAALKAFEKTINDVQDAIIAGIDTAAVNAFKRLREEVKKVNPDLEKQKKLLEEIARLMRVEYGIAFDAMLKELDKFADGLDDIADRSENLGKLQIALAKQASDAFKETANDIKSFMMEAGSAIVDVFGSAFSEIGRLQNEVVIDIVRNEEGLLEEQERIVDQHVTTTADAVGNLFEGLAKKAGEAALDFAIAKGVEMAATELAAIFSVKAAAAKGGSEAIAAHAGIPFVGIGIGLAAAAIVTAAILASLGTFQLGGVVPETGIAQVHGGERVLTERQNVAFETLVQKVETQTETGGVQGAGAGARTLSINLNMFTPGDRAEMTRRSEDSLLPMIQEWLDTGQLVVR